MRSVTLALTLITIVMALMGRRGLLRGLPLMAVLPWPLLILVGGIRSAVFGSDVLVFFAAALWIAGRYGRDHKQSPTPLRITLGVLFLYCIISSYAGAVGGIRGRPIIWAGWNGFRLLTIGLSFLIPASMILTRREAAAGLRACLLGVTILAGLGTAQAVGIIPALPSLAEMELVRGDVSQVSEFMLGFNRTALGGVCMLGFALSLGLMGIRAIKIPTGVVTAGLCVALLLSSHSRSAFFGLAVMGLALPLFGRGARIRNFVILLAGMGVTYLVISNIPAVAERFGTVASTEGVESALESGDRIGGWMALLAWFARNPHKLLLGVGFEGWIQNIYMKVIPLSTAHNAYLEVLAEIGIVGGLLWLSFWISMIIRGFRNYRHASKTDNLGGSLLILMAGLATSSLGDVFTYPANQTQSFFRLLMPVLGIYVGYFRGLQHEWSLEHYAADYEDGYSDGEAWPEDNPEAVLAYGAPGRH